MATPCEKLGYKVGDKFVVSSEKYTSDNIGALLTLTCDDGSEYPMFETDEGEIACPYLDWVKPLAKNDQLTPQTTTEPDIIARLTQAAKASNDLPSLISELNALLPEGYEVVRTTEVATEVATEDMSDWRNWKVGDMAEVVDSSYFSCTSIKNGDIVEITRIDTIDGTISTSESGCWGSPDEQYKFHSRPSKEAR